MSLFYSFLLFTQFIALAAAQSQCISFDANWNLLAFNFNGKDYNAGPQDKFSSSGSATDITAPNRPPFDVSGSPPYCFLAKFFNSIYVLNADASDKSAVYIYDAAAKSWSKQTTTGLVPKSFDPASFDAILDHDTNVFYALDSGEMISLDMGELKAAKSDAISWNDVQKPELGSSSAYQPVMGLAQNHIHFFGIPGLAAGSAKIFVIHFSFLQPDAQSYGTPAFPDAHGKATSFFKDTGVQTKIAFIPDDASSTYIIDVTTNTTTTIDAPSKDPKALYATSPTALVQLSSTGGKVSWIGFDQDSAKATTWQTLSSLPAVTPSQGGSGSSTSSSGSGSHTASSPSTSSTSNPSKGNSNNTSGALGLRADSGLILASTTLAALFVGSFAGIIGLGVGL